MADIVVIGQCLQYQGKTYRCAIGKSGFSADKKEGDGCTPVGIFPLRECWYRADRIAAPKTGLPLRVIHENDGWCDDAGSFNYNRQIKITPSPALPLAGGGSFERLWRDDHAYDLIVPMGYNDDPVVPGKGSAIFLHIAKDDYASTEGCVALAKDDLLEVLKLCDAGTMIEIGGR